MGYLMLVIVIEGKLWYYLTNNFKYKVSHFILKGMSLKMKK